MNVDISIIVVTWNTRAYVCELLESLRKDASRRSIEVIVVDNGSVDGTSEAIQAEYPEVRLIRSSYNLGFARANNVGIAKACGRYIFLVNSDVKVPQDCIGKIFAYLEGNPSIGLLGPRMLGPNGTWRRSCMRSPTLWNSLCRSLALDSLFSSSRLFGGMLMRDFSHDRVRDVDVLNGWFWAVRRSALDEVGSLDERFFMYAEDIDWCYRFQRAGWRVVFYPEAAAVHYGGISSSRSPVRFYVAKAEANIQFWAKHRGIPATALYIGSVWIGEVVRMVGYALLYVLNRHKDSLYKVKRSVATLRFLVQGTPTERPRPIN